MSAYEPDTNDIRIRQLKEELDAVREESFVKFFPTNQVGASSAIGSDGGFAPPSQGATADTPRIVKVTKDTGVIDKIIIDGITSEFVIGEVITGGTSGAVAEIGDIDIVVSGSEVQFVLVPNTLTSGNFIDNETITGSVAGSGIAKGTNFTTTGRGHLKARSTSIVAKGETSVFELHFIDDVIADGQKMLIRPFTGQTMIIRKPTTVDGNTGNIDFEESVTVGDNQVVFLQFHRGSDITPDGGVVPVTNNLVAGSGGVGSGISLPIIFDVDDKGDLDGTTSVSIDLAVTTAHVTEVRLVGATPINQTIGISGPPPDNKAILFFLKVIQDSNGGHTITLPATVSPTPTINTSPDSITMIGFLTSDNGASYQTFTFGAGGAGDNLGNHMAEQDLDMKSFDIINVDKIRFFGSGGFSFPTDNSIQGISTSGTGLQYNVPQSQSHRWFVGGQEHMRLELNNLFMLDKSIKDVGSIFFTDSGSFSSQIFPLVSNAELQYNVNGIGAFHGFHHDGGLIPIFEIRSTIVKSNVDFDVVTNDILNIDRARFTATGGFNSTLDHGDRLLSGGNDGMSMNIPRSPPFATAFKIYFENLSETDSSLEYEFFSDRIEMHQNSINDTTGIFFTNGGSIVDLGSHIQFNGGQSPFTQTIKFGVSNGSSIIDIFEITGTESGPSGVGGGLKMFADINMQTQNINNLDVLEFEPDAGTGPGGLLNGSYGIVADETGFQTSDSQLVFSIPLTSDSMSFQRGVDKRSEIEIKWDGGGSPKLRLNPFFEDTSVEASQWLFTNDHSQGTAGMLDGFMRLVSGDVIVGTGGSLVNLSNITGAINLDIDNDLGTVGSQAVEIDWNVSNFHRMIINGDITVGMNNLPDPGEWQEITVQFLQDGTGGHEVSFIDVFTNGNTPRISKGANRFTTVKFYSYNDGFERILAYEIIGRKDDLDLFHQGINQSRMSSDQNSNTTVGNHVEFDTNVFTDKIVVSSSGGQLSGIFSGFVKGRTYECECAFAIENDGGASAPATMAVQWFDRAQSQLIGTIGVATDIIIVEQRQQIAKAYFVPQNDGDTLEVRIVSNNGNADTIISGSPTNPTIQRPMSYVTIKDCGISEAEFNNLIDEDLPPSEIPPPPPPIGFSARGVHYNSYAQYSVDTPSTTRQPVNGAVVVPIEEENIMWNPTNSLTDLTIPTGKLMAPTPGRWRKTKWNITQNTLNKDMVVTIMEDENPLSTLFTIPAGATGKFTSNSSPQVVRGRRYWYRFQSVDQVNPVGDVTMSVMTEIRWGFAD